MAKSSYRPAGVDKGRSDLFTWNAADSDSYLGRMQFDGIRTTTTAPSWMSALWDKYMAEPKGRGQMLTKGQRLFELYHSSYQADSEEQTWILKRVLGAGSFGIATLLEKRNAMNRITDQVAMKSEEWSAAMCLDPSNHPFLSEEAVYMKQLNQRNEQGSVFLRGFRCLATSESVTGRPHQRVTVDENTRQRYVLYDKYVEFRSYIEYCRRGTLDSVMARYKAWGYHLPEAYIWWTFWFLVSACKAMEIDNTAPFCDGPSSVGRAISDSFMLHNDIKPENIFIADRNNQEPVQVPFALYPYARLGDYGLASVQTFTSPTNQHRSTVKGTAPWRPPEKLSIDYRVKPLPLQGDPNIKSFYYFVSRYNYNGKYRGDEHLYDKGILDGHALGPDSNLWCVAYVMYIAMTLRDEDFMAEEIRYRLDNHSLFPNYSIFDFNDFTGQLTGKEDYSPELKQLIIDCTNVIPENRPSATTVLQRIEEGLDGELKRLEEAFGNDVRAIRESTRVIWANSKWNKTPQGPVDHGIDMLSHMPDVHRRKIRRIFWKYWDLARKEGFHDPDEEQLYPPSRYKFGLDIDEEEIGDEGVGCIPYMLYNTLWQGPALPRGGRAWPAPEGNTDFLMPDFNHEPSPLPDLGERSAIHPQQSGDRPVYLQQSPQNNPGTAFFAQNEAREAAASQTSKIELAARSLQSQMLASQQLNEVHKSHPDETHMAIE